MAARETQIKKQNSLASRQACQDRQGIIGPSLCDLLNMMSMAGTKESPESTKCTH